MSIRALEIARSALIAHRAEVELIGHNIANVLTPGYCRRRGFLAQIPSEIVAVGYRSGLGVKVIGIQRLGDRLLEAQINVETASLGYAGTVADALAEVEAVVAGHSGRGLLDPLNALFDGFADIAADPGAATPRTGTIAQAQALCDAFQRADTDLQNALERNDQQVVTTVREVNRLAGEIAALNRAIGEAGGAGKSPDLEEHRAVALKELARLCGAAGAQRDNGQIAVVLGGHFLVEGDRAASLELVSDPDHPSLHTVSFKGQSPPQGLDGELAGHLEVRTTGIAAARSSLNDFAATLADAVNGVHAAGYGLDGTTGLDFFTYDASNPAATIELNPAIAADPSLIAAASAPDEPGNNENALALEQLRSEPIPPGSLSLLEMHTDALAGLGVNLQLTRAQQDARQTVVSALEGRLDAMAGVALDEEALRLAEAEKAYVAAQRVVEVALSLIDDILSLV